MTKIVIIIPTYNEGASIGSLIDEIEKEFLKIPNNSMEILVVDGKSEDKTGDIVRGKSNQYKNIELLVEQKKRGLGMAYIEGMHYAVEKMGADAFIEFDGDFQHDPKDIKRLVAEFDNGYDYVIGSRYVPGGATPKHWGWHRKLLSRFGGWITKQVLRLPIRDNTSGLKLSRVKGFFDKLPLSEDRILSKRHAYKLHLLYVMFKSRAKIKEIPIVFLERDGGASKSTLEDIFESLRVIFILWFRNFRREKQWK